MKEKSKSEVSIIGGADGPTSIFIAGRTRKKPLKVRIRNIIYRYRRKIVDRQYNALQKSYEDDSRDIYICDGSNAEGKLQYHKVSKGEDVTFLNQAFDRIADSLGFTANGCESQLKINELFGGQKAPELSLPDNYEEKLSGIMKKAAATYAEQKKNGNNVNATNLALKYLNEDADFSDVMHQLFSNIRPMRILHRNTKLSLFQKAVVKKCMS